MSTNNAVNTTLSGQTGTGTFVGATSPTLVTPNIGVATATSLTFGGSVLSAYTATTSFTPTVIFDTLGNLSVSYAEQVGFYSRIGSIVSFYVRLTFTPTYTTSAGNLRITGLPVPVNASTIPVAAAFVSGVTFPAGATSVSAVGTNNGGSGLGQYAFIGSGSAATIQTFSVTQFVSGVQYLVSITGSYLA